MAFTFVTKDINKNISTYHNNYFWSNILLNILLICLDCFPLLSQRTRTGIIRLNTQFPIQTVVTGFFFPRSAVPKIGSVVCFLGPLGDVGSFLE